MKTAYQGKNLKDVGFKDSNHVRTYRDELVRQFGKLPSFKDARKQSEMPNGERWNKPSYRLFKSYCGDLIEVK